MELVSSLRIARDRKAVNGEDHHAVRPSFFTFRMVVSRDLTVHAANQQLHAGFHIPPSGLNTNTTAVLTIIAILQVKLRNQKIDHRVFVVPP